jgi:glycosyltransferase involved in cell wall biosynthesis
MIPVDKLPSITVIIPNRNDAAYINTCLNSVLNQSITPDQIVFVDDSSQDNSIAIAQMALRDFNNAKIIANPKCLGTVGALNEGLKRATSDYVLFLASNDFLLDRIFERAKQSIFATGFPGIWSAMVWAADENGTPMYLYPSSVVKLKGDYIPPEECIRLSMKTASWFTGTTLFFNRKALNEIGGLDMEYQGLADLLAALTISSTNGATFIAEPLGVMRIHDDGYLHRTITDLGNLEQIISAIEKKGPILSPRLFTDYFCRRMSNRFRFAAFRAISDMRNTKWHESWNGWQYSILKKTIPLMEKHNTFKIITAMFLLRPFDIIPFIRYRLIGPLWVMARRTGANKKGKYVC